MTPSSGPPSASLWSWRSRRSILSVASDGSVLSIGSAGSILSIGSVGSICSLGGTGSFASMLSVGSWMSRGSLLSYQSDGSVLSYQSRFARRSRRTDGRAGAAQARTLAVASVACAGLTYGAVVALSRGRRLSRTSAAPGRTWRAPRC